MISPQQGTYPSFYYLQQCMSQTIALRFYQSIRNDERKCNIQEEHPITGQASPILGSLILLPLLLITGQLPFGWVSSPPLHPHLRQDPQWLGVRVRWTLGGRKALPSPQSAACLPNHVFPWMMGGAYFQSLQEELHHQSDPKGLINGKP